MTNPQDGTYEVLINRATHVITLRIIGNDQNTFTFNFDRTSTADLIARLQDALEGLPADPSTKARHP